MKKKLILASTSTIYGGTFLSYLFPSLKTHFETSKTITFIPYARPGGISYERYTSIVRNAFSHIDINVKGIHEYSDPLEAMANATGIYTGGGNTFVLLKTLYNQNLIPALREKIESGVPYLGSSAGSNIAGPNIQTTNDMPIVYPPSFESLDILPFNINPHYKDPESGSKHMGETRETRIKEFHIYNTLPVIGLREGSWLEVQDTTIYLKGLHTARIFKKDEDAFEHPSESILKL